MNAIQKPLSSVKNILQKPHRPLAGVLIADLLRFMQNLMQTRCSILPSIADKTKHKVEKASVLWKWLLEGEVENVNCVSL
jgi:hypothetical protein